MAPLGGISEGIGGDHGVAPQMETDHQQEEGEREWETRAGSEQASRVEGIMGRPGVVVTQYLSVSRIRSRSGSIRRAVLNLNRQTLGLRTAREEAGRKTLKTENSIERRQLAQEAGMTVAEAANATEDRRGNIT